MDDSFVIEGLGGEKTLHGSIQVRGAKNAALKAMAASLLFEDEVRLDNVPKIEDIARTHELLTKLGADVERENSSFAISTSDVESFELDEDIAKRMRASIVLTGPLLARFGKVSLPHPGGCVIGARPIDIFINGFKKMGARITENDEHYVFDTGGKKLSGGDIFLRTPSVTATETFMLAATLAKGTTTIKNAAHEPEIESLAEYLVTCGADISGAGTPTIVIRGGDMLQADGRVYHTIPDRLEAGSFLVLGALAAKELTITHCNPDHLEIVIATLRDTGADIEVDHDARTMIVRNSRDQKPYSAFNIKTHEYPGFPTDIQAPTTVLLTQAQGESIVFETIYEGRLNYVDDLIRMGADIITFDPHRVLIKGPTPLRGKEVYGPDIRAGLAFVIAGIIAEGTTTIHNAYFIDRGHEEIEKRLTDIGVTIARVTR